MVSKDSKVNDKAKNKLKKKQAKASAGAAKAQDDATVDIDVNNVLNLAPKAPVAEVEDDDDNEEVTLQERKLDMKGKGKGKNVAFEQRDLVSRAFAGDNVVQVQLSLHSKRACSDGLRRTSKQQKSVRWSLTRQRRSIQHYLAGYGASSCLNTTR